jgi:transposase InsO family protein
MKIHGLTKLTPIQREQVYKDHFVHKIRVCDLARKYLVSPPTIHKVLTRGRANDFTVHKSTNKRFRTISYGLRRLAKIEKIIEERLKNQARRYNKDYPGQMIHVDSKRLPHLSGETQREPTQTLFVAIDDYSRELYAAILPTKNQWSSTTFLNQVLEECPYTIEDIYSDNGSEFKGLPHHAFAKTCHENGIGQHFTKPRTPQTNGKAERVIKTIMTMWYAKTEFKSRAHRQQELTRFVNFYNTVKPHASLENKTPLEQLIHYFYPQEL